MRGQTHLIVSAFSILDRQPQTALCGLEMQKAERQFCWDEFRVGTTVPENTLLICHKCISKLIASQEPLPQYVYGVREENESKRDDTAFE